jgi:hypothetical protein
MVPVAEDGPQSNVLCPEGAGLPRQPGRNEEGALWGGEGQHDRSKRGQYVCVCVGLGHACIRHRQMVTTCLPQAAHLCLPWARCLWQKEGCSGLLHLPSATEQQTILNLSVTSWPATPAYVGSTCQVCTLPCASEGEQGRLLHPHRTCWLCMLQPCHIPGRQVDVGTPVLLYQDQASILQTAVQTAPGALSRQSSGQTPFMTFSGLPRHISAA